MTERQRKVEYDYRKKLIEQHGVKEAAERLEMTYGALRYWMWCNKIRANDFKMRKLPVGQRLELMLKDIKELEDRYGIHLLIADWQAKRGRPKR